MKSNQKKITLLVGTGAVVNSWLPIIDVLKPDYNFDLDADSANCFLARMIYNLRIFATSDDPNVKGFLPDVLNDFRKIKSRISKALHSYELENKIYPRKEFSSILDKFIFQDSTEFVLVSTNWDTVIDKAINLKHSGRVETYHLHGITTNPNEFYLPSEIATEPYRPEHEREIILSNHAALLHAISDSHCIILYGLSLDPLDAELSQVLSMGFESPNIKEIIIINPDHKRIAKRVKLLLYEWIKKVDVYAYLPDDLSRKIQY